MMIFGAVNYSKMTISGGKFVAFIKEQKISFCFTIFGAENRQNDDFMSQFYGSIKIQKLTVLDVFGAEFSLELLIFWVNILCAFYCFSKRCWNKF